MSALQVLEEAAADGVELSVTPSGTVKARGSQDAVKRWVPILREHKSELLAALTRAANGEPAPSMPLRQATPSEVAELKRLIASVYCNDTELERAEALAIAVADSTAALICYRCLARARAAAHHR